MEDDLKQRIRTKCAVVGLVASGIIWFHGNAAAAPTLTLTTGSGATATIADETASDASLGTPGVVTFAGTIGAFEVQLTLGQTKPSSGSESQPILKISNTTIDFTGTSSDSLTIAFSETGFQGQGIRRVVSSLGGDAIGGATLSSFEVYIDTTNTLFETPAAGLVGDVGPVGGRAFSAKDGEVFDLGPTPQSYAVTQIARVAGAPSSNISFDASTTIPAPTILSLFGIGLMGLGFMGWRDTPAT